MRGGTIIWLGLAMWLCHKAMGMDMDIRMDSFAPRSNAPIPVTISLEGDHPLLEGRLLVELIDGNRRLIHFQTEPMALTNTKVERRLLLPAIPPGASMRGQAEWRLTFETSEERFHKAGLLVTIPGEGQRIAVVAVVHPDPQKPPVALRDLLNNEGLETVLGFGGSVQGQPNIFNQVVTWKAALQPNHLPSQALALCSYDMVALTPESLGILSGQQTQALTTWIRAGGSVLITRHPDLPLTNRSAMSGRLKSLSQQGRQAEILATPAQKEIGITLASWQWDLGRVVILEGLTTDTDHEHPSWRKVFNFLWNVRDLEEVDQRVKDGNSLAKTYTQLDEQALTGTPLRQALRSHLMPRGINILPTWQLGVIMLAFFLVAGPTEHFLLKRLRRRWLTWITFPTILLGMTLGSFLLADKLLGRSSVKRLELVDLSIDGQEVVRRHTSELTFGKESKATLYPQRNRTISRDFSSDERPVPTFHTGRYPAHYQTQRKIERWTPYTEQSLELGAVTTLPPELMAIDWADYHPLMPNAEQRLHSRLKDIKGYEGLGMQYGHSLQSLIHGNPTSTLTELFGKQLAANTAVPYRTFPNAGPIRLMITINGKPMGNNSSRFIADESAWLPFPRIGSPHGNGDLSDWIIVDHNQWLLSFKHDEQQVIYRYTYPEHD